MFSARALLLAAVLSVASTLSSAQNPSTGPLRVAIVGLEHGHVDGFLSGIQNRDDVQLVGISDPDPALFAKYQQKFNLPGSIPFFPTEAAMIQAVHPQAVLVYTSIAGHRPAIETAAEYGVSVMVEKPLTISLDDALAIRSTADAHHIHVLVNYETTWYPSNHAVYHEVRDNHLGPIRRVVVNDGHQGPEEIGVPPEFLKWLTDPAQNGAGAMYDFGCYGADLVTWLMRGKAPLAVTAMAHTDKRDRYPRVDDDATILLEYPQAQAVIQASWNWPFGRKDMEVYGATGYAIAADKNHLRMRQEHDSSEQVHDVTWLPDNEKDSITYLAAVLNGKIVPRGDLSSLDTNIVVMQILDAARESARTGRTIRLTSIPE
jgi:glucose-fructose oxidoreductase